jgi:trehalose/maltose hydrolase-like predicted phosphorylase
MRASRLTGSRVAALFVLAAVLAWVAGCGGSGPGPGAPSGDTGSYLLTATNAGADYAPTFTGNGYLGTRVPPAGQGYAAGTVPAASEVAGFYAQPAGTPQHIANIPTWSTLTFSDGGQDFAPGEGRTADWRQELDLHDGSIATTAQWTSSNGHVTDLRYLVLTDRARPNVATVALQLTPRWSGTATVTDLIDGNPASLTTAVASGSDPGTRLVWETVCAQGTGVVAAVASTMALSPDAPSAAYTPISDSASRTVGQRLAFPVTPGGTYTLTKYVGVSTSHEAGQPDAVARQQSSAAAHDGFAALRTENTAAWAALWANRIDVLGNPKLATWVNASEFYLWSSTRAGVDWSVSPAGLSSNDYNGHIFWDAETWMYPPLLAQHPALAAGMNNYRFQRLGAARANAALTNTTGARFPWESALDGTEQIPPPVVANSEGIYEQHITADVALAQWQYYLATGDRSWLRERGWPVLSQTATFWAGRARSDPDGYYHIDTVTGPDEFNTHINDEAYTNVGAATTLRLANRAAQVLGIAAPASWTTIADGLAPLYDPSTDTHPEFIGYQGQMVKQADVTMLQYPWLFPMSSMTAQRDVDHYVPRSDPDGPSMADAINVIDTAKLGSPGCSSYAYTQRSAEPFIRDVFDQFSESRTGGAFTFTTGIGGFLQEFLFGFSGLRWDDGAVQLDPSLTGDITGVVLHGLAWHGSRFTVSIGAKDTRVSLDSGAPVPVRIAGNTETVAAGVPMSVPTRRPDLAPTSDLARCRPATASSAQAGADPLSAVDGSPATFWQPTQIGSALTVSLAQPRTISSATLDWGRVWPPKPVDGPDLPAPPPPAGPVRTLRATDYDLVVSTDGRHWTTVARVRGRITGVHDTLNFAPTSAAQVGVRITGATEQTPPMLAELTVPGS